MQLKRKKLGEQWYSFAIPQGRAGIRCFDRNSWGYYFRGPNTEAIGINEFRTHSYKSALRKVQKFADTGRLE